MSEHLDSGAQPKMYNFEQRLEIMRRFAKGLKEAGIEYQPTSFVYVNEGGSNRITEEELKERQIEDVPARLLNT